MPIIVRKAETFKDYAACVVVRYRVFVVSQNVPDELEIDDHEDTAVHYLALDGDAPVGTARYRLMDGGAGKIAGKIERMAVLPDRQRRGVGTALVQRLVDDLKALGTVAIVKAGAQTHAIAFYERFGFQAEGPVYMDAGIPHRDIVMTV